MSTDVELLRHQYDFLQSREKRLMVLGGVGSGKTWVGAHFGIKMFAEYPRAKGLITANTYTQLMNATVPTLLAELDVCGIQYHAVLSGARKRVEVSNTVAYLYSLEKPDNIRGIEAAWWWDDEGAFSKEYAIKVCRGRLRGKHGPLYERHTTTPNGYNWAYEENIEGNLEIIKAKTCDNLFLPDEYYQDLLEDYGGVDNPLAQQELFGEFVNLNAGAIYWAFDRKLHVAPCKLDKDRLIDIGQDFNIDNMSSAIVQRDNGHYYVCEEVVMQQRNSNTDTTSSYLVKEYKDYNKVVIPDSTGKSRNTANTSNTSDIQIMESYGLRVLPTRNPLIRDRQNALNILLKKNKVTIDPSCINLIKELETLSSRDKEGDVAHCSPALGYIVNYYDPLMRDRGRTHSIAL